VLLTPLPALVKTERRIFSLDPQVGRLAGLACRTNSALLLLAIGFLHRYTLKVPGSHGVPCGVPFPGPRTDTVQEEEQLSQHLHIAYYLTYYSDSLSLSLPLNGK